jgi:hypothetical protein
MREKRVAREEELEIGWEMLIEIKEKMDNMFP